MTTIVLIVVAILALAVLYEALKKGAKSEDVSAEDDFNVETPTADEALPTLTGRFRAQQVLAKVEKTEETEEEKKEASPFSDDPDSPLPDPFSKDDS